jgi:thimet oligopeptidase
MIYAAATRRSVSFRLIGIGLRMATSGAFAVPHKDLYWHYSPDEIRERTKGLITEADSILDKVGSCTGPQCTWDNVIAPLASMERDAEGRTISLTFVKDVSPLKDVRTAATAAQAELSTWEVKSGMREDVFRAVKTFAETADLTALDAEGRRFVERTLREYRRRGLDLPAADRAKVEALKTRLSDIAVAFQQALAEDATKLAFSRAELAGLPDDFVEGLGDGCSDCTRAVCNSWGARSDNVPSHLCSCGAL